VTKYKAAKERQLKKAVKSANKKYRETVSPHGPRQRSLKQICHSYRFGVWKCKSVTRRNELLKLLKDNKCPAPNTHRGILRHFGQPFMHVKE